MRLTKFATPFLCIAALSFAACGDDAGDDDDDDDDDVTVDAAGDDDDDTVDAAGDDDDDSVDANNGTCLTPASYGDVEPTGATAAADPSVEAPEFISYTGSINGSDDLIVELYNGFGVFAEGIATGTFELTGDELSYADCGLCVLVGVDMVEGAPTEIYMATGGSVEITAFTPNITGNLIDVTLQHVDIAQGGVTTPNADGCTSAIGGAFDAALEGPAQ